MIAAIYARKSNDQRDRDDEEKSVAHQVRRAREYIATKGWVLDEDSVFVDDGISGAEFSKRPNLVRLLRALTQKPKPAFEVLVVADSDRLGRETIETAFVLKQIVQAGVRVFFYRDDRERTLDNPIDKVMLSVTAFADELKRVKDSQAAYDKASEKARNGHVVGAVVFGFDNITVLGASGKKSHVTRVINPTQAAVIRRMFALSAKGYGYTRIAKLLNAEHAPAPRPKTGRPAGWSPSTVKIILDRRLYLGETVWGRTKKRDSWGRKALRRRPEAEWVRGSVEPIVTEAEWRAAHDRLDGVRARLQATGAASGNRRSRDIDSDYLLSGFARCTTCGGGMAVLGGSRSSARHHSYGCLSYHKRGPAVCPNGLKIPMNRVDDAVLTAIAGEVLRPAVVMAVVDRVIASLAPSAVGRDVDELRTALQGVEREIRNLTRAIAAGGQLESLLDALQTCEKRRDELRASIAARESVQVHCIDRAGIEASVRRRVDDWRSLLTRRVTHGRQLLREMLVGPLRFTPNGRAYRFEGEASFGALLSGEVEVSTNVVAIRGFEPRFCG